MTKCHDYTPVDARRGVCHDPAMQLPTPLQQTAATSLLVLATACGDPPSTCYTPSSADLSKWSARSGSDADPPVLAYDCGKATGLRLRTPAGVAGLARGSWTPPDPDDLSQALLLHARSRVDSGSGRVLVVVWHDDGTGYNEVARTTPSSDGNVGLVVLRHLDEYRIDFIGFAGSDAMTWAVGPVELNAIQVVSDGIHLHGSE